MEKIVSVLNVGVVGSNKWDFDKSGALEQLNAALDRVIDDHPEPEEIWVVCDETDEGIPALAHQIARERNRNDEYRIWRTTSVTQSQDGQSGNESEAFLASIDVIVCIGNDTRALAETQLFKSMHGDNGNVVYDLSSQ